MFLTIPSDFSKQWCCYVLTDCNGVAFHADIVRFKELTMLEGIIVPDVVAYLTVIETDVDRLKLANRMFAVLPVNHPGMEWKIRDAVVRWGKDGRCNGRPVLCMDTGESWKSAHTAALTHNLSYGQLLKHLSGAVGYKTVKGRVYRWAGAA